LFERFTERARRVVAHAQEESRTLKTGHVGTEHLLLGLLREGRGVAVQVLESSGITVDRTRGEVVRIVGVGQESAADQVSFTPRARKTLELALREALALGHNYIDPEHILLALTTIKDSSADRILRDCQADPQMIRAEVLRVITRPPEAVRPSPPAEPSPSANGFDEWIRVGPGSGVRRLLMGAAARALDDGRSGIEPRDVLLALTRDEQAGPMLADLGVDEPAVLRAIERRRPPEAPPRDPSRN
jgi:ATP-dependent Clp protease ATP-binding subunit ClpA